MVDNRSSATPLIDADKARRVCDRNRGVGGDGVIFALPPTAPSADFSMRVFNSDGSEPEMCGNGIRCLAHFVAAADRQTGERTYRVATAAGLIQPQILEDGRVRVDMGRPELGGPKVPTTLPSSRADGAVVQAPLDVDGKVWRVTCVSMGNPHAVVFANDQDREFQVADLDLARLGPQFECNAAFPARVNTEFVQVKSPSLVKMRVWERGAGPTLACGTGACAIVVAGVLENRLDRTCRVELPGGDLDIEWAADGRVYMTGPAVAVFEGELLI